jgi:fructose-1,6-bisphosphatase I
MNQRESLQSYLRTWAGSDQQREQISTTVKVLAETCIGLSGLLATGALTGPLGTHTTKTTEIDPQRELDVVANTRIIAALAHAPVALLISEELDDPLEMTANAPLVVAIDPLDGASNADTNAAIGTIFSILPNLAEPALWNGTQQLAAGFVVYGPQTVLALTVGSGTRIFTLNRATSAFETTGWDIKIPNQAAEFAINASNHWHWDDAIRVFVDDCLRGREGPRGADYNMRWTGSFVAEIYRILVRGGIYLYPGDKRPGFRHGRMRLIYEANPVAFLVEQADGAASTGRERLLETTARTLHQRTPIFIGSRAEVAYVDRLHQDPHTFTERSPLFGRRGLFRV